MLELDSYLCEALSHLEATHRARRLHATMRQDGVCVQREDHEFISFSCNDYLGLTHHPQVKEAAIQAICDYGTGAGASRLITGNHPLYATLEAKLAALKGTEAACVFGSGYLANTGVIRALAGREDLLLADRLAHASLLDGMRASKAAWKRFAHNDMAALERLLDTHRAQHRHCIILTETVFSMDGDRAPLEALCKLARAYDAWLLTDDAHGLGVLEPETRHLKPDIQLGTLSKTVGAYGGYVCGSTTLVEYLHSTARTLIYSTALPPPVVAAALAALEIIGRDAALVAAPLEAAQLFTECAGLPEPDSAIVPVRLGSAKAALAASRLLEERGYLVAAIRPPTVPEDTARLRFAFSALHKERHIRGVAEIVREQGWG